MISRQAAPPASSARLADHALPLLALTALIILANAIALFGPYDDDPSVFLSGLSVITQHGIWFGRPNWYDPNIGFTAQALGQLAADDWLRGVVPWWNPYAGVGMPLAAELQNYAQFFPFVLLMHLHAGWIYLRVIAQIAAGLCTYALLVQLQFARRAALLSGLMYACSWSFILLADSPSMTFVFTPMLLLGIERLRAAAILQAPMGWSVVTIAVAYSFYAGFPETAFFGDLLGAAWFAARLPGVPPACRMLYGAKFAIAVALGLILTLPGLLPFAEYIRLGVIGGHAKDFASSHLNGLGFAEQILPLIFGPLCTAPIYVPGMQHNPLIVALSQSEDQSGGWFGALPVLFAIIGIMTNAGELRAAKWMLAAWVIIWQARSFGVPGVTSVIDLVHPLSLIMVYRYAQPSCDFAVIVLAGIAINAWLNHRLVPRIVMASALLTLLLFGIAMVLALPVLSFLHRHFDGYASLAITYTGLMLLLAVSLCRTLARPPGAKAIAEVSVTLILYTVLGFALSEAAGARRSRTDTMGTSFLAAHTGLSRMYTLGPLAPNYAGDFGIAEINHIALPAPKLWAGFIAAKLDEGADPISFTGNYAGRPANLPDAAAELRRNIAAYQAIGVKYIVVPPGENPFAAGALAPPRVLRTPAMDIYQLPAPAPYFNVSGSSCSIAVNTRQSLHVRCSAPARLTRQELFYPGWHATVNGAATPISQTEIFQSIDVPAGISQINYYYRPAHERSACLAALTAACIWLGLLYRPRFRRASRAAT